MGVLFIKGFFLYVAIYLYLLYDLMILVILRYYFRLRNLILPANFNGQCNNANKIIHLSKICMLFFFLSVYIITSNRFFAFIKKIVGCLICKHKHLRIVQQIFFYNENEL